jgi:hypothetical protein
VQGNVVGGNGIGWSIVVSKDLMHVNEKGMGWSKRENDKKIDIDGYFWLSFLCFNVWVLVLFCATC